MILVRHTRPDVEPGTCYGRSDLGLAPGFEAEAERVLSALPEVTRVVSSPLSRCLTLARWIGAARGVPVTVAQDWVEMDFGRWEMRPWAALPRAELDAWAEDFMHYRGHGGESVADLHARVGRGLEGLKPGALVVTHMGVIKAALAHCRVPGAWDAQLEFGGLVDLAALR